MTHQVHLPDAMPEIAEPTLLVVCGSHECRFIDAGGKTLLEKEVLHSKERNDTDRETQMRGPSGIMSGTSDRNQFEDNRLKNFANQVIARIGAASKDQGITAVYLSAPGKLLSALKADFSKPLAAILKETIDGTFLKEPALDILVRFRPDLMEGVKHLRDQENYSAANRPPIK